MIDHYLFFVKLDFFILETVETKICLLHKGMQKVCMQKVCIATYKGRQE
jgi:hypothetical protein